MLKPWLQDKLQHSWLDPRKVKDKDEFFYEYVTAWGFAQAVDEILRFVEQIKSRTEFLRKKEKGGIEDQFAIGK